MNEKDKGGYLISGGDGSGVGGGGGGEAPGVVHGERDGNSSIASSSSSLEYGNSKEKKG